MDERQKHSSGVSKRTGEPRVPDELHIGLREDLAAVAQEAAGWNGTPPHQCDEHLVASLADVVARQMESAWGHWRDSSLERLRSVLLELMDQAAARSGLPAFLGFVHDDDVLALARPTREARTRLTMGMIKPIDGVVPDASECGTRADLDMPFGLSCVTTSLDRESGSLRIVATACDDAHWTRVPVFLECASSWWEWGCEDSERRLRLEAPSGSPLFCQVVAGRSGHALHEGAALRATWWCEGLGPAGPGRFASADAGPRYVNGIAIEWRPGEQRTLDVSIPLAGLGVEAAHVGAVRAPMTRAMLCQLAGRTDQQAARPGRWTVEVDTGRRVHRLQPLSVLLARSGAQNDRAPADAGTALELRAMARRIAGVRALYSRADLADAVNARLACVPGDWSLWTSPDLVCGTALFCRDSQNLEVAWKVRVVAGQGRAPVGSSLREISAALRRVEEWLAPLLPAGVRLCVELGEPATRRVARRASRRPSSLTRGSLVAGARARLRCGAGYRRGKLSRPGGRPVGWKTLARSNDDALEVHVGSPRAADVWPGPPGARTPGFRESWLDVVDHARVAGALMLQELAGELSADSSVATAVLDAMFNDRSWRFDRKPGVEVELRLRALFGGVSRSDLAWALERVFGPGAVAVRGFDAPIGSATSAFVRRRRRAGAAAFPPRVGRAVLAVRGVELSLDVPPDFATDTMGFWQPNTTNLDSAPGANAALARVIGELFTAPHTPIRA